MTAEGYDYRGARAAILGSGLPGSLKLLALVLVEYMPNCCPSVLTLAGQCGVERKTVLRALGRLERLGVLSVERSPGQRSRYVLQPVQAWREATPRERSAVFERGGTGKGPVPISRTGTDSGPVPTSTGTGPKEGMGPVPNEAPTSPIAVGPEAVLSRSRKQGEAAHARVLAAAGFGPPSPNAAVPGRSYTMPQAEPTPSYLAECVVAGVSPAQAHSTWKHYWTEGLPTRGVEKLESWLVLSAKARQDQLASVPKGNRAPEPPESPVDFDPRFVDAVHRDFCGRHGLKVEALAREWRKAAVASGKRYDRVQAERAFGEFLRERVRVVRKGASP